MYKHDAWSFDEFKAPSLFGGELRCFDTDPGSERDVVRVVEHVARLASESEVLEVRTLDLGECRLDEVQLRVVERLAECIPRFCWLVQLRLHGCRMGTSASVTILCSLQQLPAFMYGSIARAEVGLRYNNLESDTFDRLAGMLPTGTRLGGVCKLLLDGNPLDDRAVDIAARMFPRLTALHVSSTSMRGASLTTLVSILPRLTLLGIDNNPLCEDAPHCILHSMTQRAQSTPVEAIEVWARGTSTYSDEWSKLFVFVSRASNSRFVLKHDLLAGLASRPRNVSLVHAVVRIQLLIHGLQAVVVEHERVLSTKPVLQIASEVINELNLVCMGDDADVRDRLIMKRRTLYRSALQCLLYIGNLTGKRYGLGVVELHRVDKYSGEESVVSYYPYRSLLGPPDTCGVLILVVEAEECTIQS